MIFSYSRMDSVLDGKAEIRIQPRPKEESESRDIMSHK